MSTVSYLRVTLKVAEKRLTKYRAKLAELEADLAKEATYKRARAVSDLKSSNEYLSAQIAVKNIEAALGREEARLFSNPAAKL